MIVLNEISNSKLQTDIIFNLISIFIMGISAILINIVIGAFYGAGALGIFNQIYAIYIFASQLAALGLPPAVLKYVAEYSENQHEVSAIVFTGLLMAALLGFTVCILIVFCHSIIGSLLESPGVSSGLLWAVPGLFFFTLNKVMLASVNGLEKMRLYAVLQSGRYIFMILSLLVEAPHISEPTGH